MLDVSGRPTLKECQMIQDFLSISTVSTDDYFYTGVITSTGDNLVRVGNQNLRATEVDQWNNANWQACFNVMK